MPSKHGGETCKILENMETVQQSEEKGLGVSIEETMSRSE
jgi:hypothetical protein